ncbi:MAG: iron-containing redox enzyme family protein, partial [Acidimicrobiales bacterium]
MSDFVLSALQREPGTLGPSPSLSQVDALSSDDFGLALYLCYELHFRNLSEAEWEWDPDLLRFRREMELVFEGRLRDEVGWVTPGAALSVGIALEELIQQCSGLSLSDYLNDDGTLDQFRELCVHRSAYHLREADPHAFGIPRLTGDAKAALVEMQYDDYGYGNVE